MQEENKLPLRPLFARVLLKRDSSEVTKGGILLPTAKQEVRGQIVAVGETCADIIKGMVGKTVYFGKFSGDWLKHNDDEYFICQDEDILAEVVE